MPRELVNAKTSSGGIYYKDWVQQNYEPDNYNSGRTAVFKFVDHKYNGDLIYKLSNIEDDYANAKIESFDNNNESTVFLMETPISYNEKVKCVKMDDDVLYYNKQKPGIRHAWDVTLDSDYTRIQCCVFHAASESTNNRQLSIDNIDVALSVLKSHKYFYEREPELQRLTNIVYDTPKMRDTMQKYISSIINEKEFDNTQLETMFNTVIERNQKNNNGKNNVYSLFGILLMLPLIKQHYTEECDTWTIAPVIYDVFLKIVKRLPIDDYNKCVVSMGKVFGCIDKSNFSKSLNNISNNIKVQNFPIYNDSVIWLKKNNTTRTKRIDENTIRIMSINIEPFNTIYINLFEALKMNNTIQLTFTPLHPENAKIDIKYGRNIYLNPYTKISPIISKHNNTIVVNVINDQFWEFLYNKSELVINFKYLILDIKIIENNWRNTSKTQYIGYNHNDVCCICLNDLIGRNAKTVLQCKHIFHKDCIKKWNDFSNACPICKAVH